MNARFSDPPAAVVDPGLRLPPFAPGESPVKERPSAPTSPRVSILLVDDESRNLDVLESILASPDYELVRAESADAALLAILQHQFAAIILDIQMPGTDGFELARLIKQRKRSQHIPILFLTAYFQDDADVLTGYGRGAVDYLTKPVNPQILKSKVGVFANLFRMTRALAEANAILENEILQRKKAELASARLAAIVESSADAIFSRSLAGMITYWNRGAEQLFGYHPDEIIGQPVARLVPPDRVEELKTADDRVARGEAVESFETVRLGRDGRRLDVSVTHSVILDVAGQVTGISYIIRDISGRKRLEAEIFEANEREQQRIANDLHEGLGQQLAGISCLSDALGKDLTVGRVAYAPHAFSISRLLNSAVAQTRSLSRGLHPVVAEPNGLMTALQELAGNVTRLFNVPCSFKCAPLVLVHDHVAATHLFRIAQEAVTDAISHGRAPQIEIELSAEPAQVVLTVRDRGGDASRLVGESSPLGMRLMKYRAGMIGGQVTVRKRPDGGTEAVCTVPNPDPNLKPT